MSVEFSIEFNSFKCDRNATVDDHYFTGSCEFVIIVTSGRKDVSVYVVDIRH